MTPGSAALRDITTELNRLQMEENGRRKRDSNHDSRAKEKGCTTDAELDLLLLNKYKDGLIDPKISILPILPTPFVDRLKHQKGSVSVVYVVLMYSYFNTKKSLCSTAVLLSCCALHAGCTLTTSFLRHAVMPECKRSVVGLLHSCK